MAVSVLSLADPWQGQSFAPYVKSYSITCWQWYPSHKTCSISWLSATSRYTCLGSTSGSGLPLLLGCFTGRVPSNSPHKTLFEPGCFNISLSPPSKEAFLVLWRHGDLSVQSTWHLWRSPGACCCCPRFKSIPPARSAVSCRSAASLEMLRVSCICSDCSVCSGRDLC